MELKNFKKDIDIIYKDNTISSYTQIDNIDNFIEIAIPYNNTNIKVVSYYKKCERARMEVYDNLTEEDINKAICEIYEGV